LLIDQVEPHYKPPQKEDICTLQSTPAVSADVNAPAVVVSSRTASETEEGQVDLVE